MVVESPFAEVSDLEARWRTLTTSESTKATELLADASDVIMTTCSAWESASEATLKRIACAMVKRAMASPVTDLDASISSASRTAGPFTQQTTFANPSGDLYLTKAEKLSLGCGKQRAFEVDLAAPKEES